MLTCWLLFTLGTMSCKSEQCCLPTERMAGDRLLAAIVVSVQVLTKKFFKYLFLFFKP